MSKKLTEKYNDSCIKLFNFIHMLYEDKAEFKDVIDLMSDGNYSGKSNTHVTLNKYLNALEIFGIKVKKIKHKYKMSKSLCSIDFNNNDVKCINLLKNAKELLPEGKNKKNLEELVKSIEIRLDENLLNITNTIRPNILHPNKIDFIKLCEKYCEENRKLEIIFKNFDGEEINLLGTLIEIQHTKNSTSLYVLGNNGSRIYEIPIENIISIEQLPAFSSNISIPTTITFRIKNRLAKNYRLRDWEKLEKIEDNGSRIIINKNEDFNKFIKRLMRYGTECEIISPKFIKDEMIEFINKTLSNYQ